MGDQDLEWVHALNQIHAEELSSLNRAAFANLVASASVAIVVEDAAFLIAFDHNATYDNANFAWFKIRYPTFTYVDRIAVAKARRRDGCARLLYDTVFAYARQRNAESVVCEINTDPPNPASDAFHLSLGFSEVGQAELTDRGKSVRYYQYLL